MRPQYCRLRHTVNSLETWKVIFLKHHPACAKGYYVGPHVL